MYVYRNKLICCLAVALLSSPVSVFAEEEIQIVSETEETEKTSSPASEESDPETVESSNTTESEAQTDEFEERKISDAQPAQMNPDESASTVTIKDWEWNDRDYVVKEDCVDIDRSNTGYILTYQNFSSCLPDSISTDETGDIEIREWSCKELDLEPGTELLSLNKDSIHLLAVLADSYIADPEPLLTIRFLKLTPTGKFTGKEKGIWKWVVRNK